MFPKDILTSSQFTLLDLNVISNRITHIKNELLFSRKLDILNGFNIGCLFYQPSTRTFSSFISAASLLGATTIPLHGVNNLSVAKGESLEDTVKSLEQYCDLIVLRHPEVGAAQKAADICEIPVINAGDGVGEHPTQSLLDLYTIGSELGYINGINISMLGDLKHSRTIHSLIKLASLYDVSFSFVSPKELQLDSEYKALLNKNSVKYNEYESLDDVISHTNVLYVTRIQKEYFDGAAFEGTYKVDRAILNKAKSNLVLLHPLPRVNEIDPLVDCDKRAAYFRQVKNGLYVRAALLSLILNPNFY